MIRRTLPQRRAAETFDLRFWSQNVTVTVGFYADGTPGEVFIEHGTPIEAIRRAVTRNGSGEAASILGAVVDVLLATGGGAV